MNASRHKPVVAAAVSGGVDSLCALVLLRQRGYRILALHALFLPDSSAPPGLAEACAALDVPLHVLDMTTVFEREVLAPFAAAYARGKTPNPCILCNRAVKWGALLDAAQDLGAEYLATGHYARLAKNPLHGAPPLLAAARDAAKDQSYFLSMVPGERLRRALFPLEELRKDEVRALVAGAGLPVPLLPESQDICFAPGAGPGAYQNFLEARWQAAGIPRPGPGPVLLADSAGNTHPIARHEGLWRYTEGQRKGLGIAHSEPLFVLGKDVGANALVVGPRALLGSTGCVTLPANVALPARLWPRELLVRLRHRQQPVPARVSLTADSRLRITFDEPRFPGAPGQVAAVYDRQGRILAAGIMDAQQESPPASA